MTKPVKGEKAPRKVSRPKKVRREREEKFTFLELFEDCALTEDEREAFRFIDVD